ncbi:MAG: DUF1727 domain-containing protein [Eubacterium sp.]|nr:DUF1727 domain-containing protein [Eubacterium sp.]
MLILRISGKGATSLPGKAAVFLKRDILRRLSKGVKIICVTGTNGKTTTCALLSYAMRKSGVSFFTNGSGANMMSGVVTAFIKNCNIFGKCKKEYAILECDENSFYEISKHAEISVIAVTNIFRDQLDRYGEVGYIRAQIVRAINENKNALLILNADCPISYYISKICDNNFLSFGVNARRISESVSDIKFCPVCSHELKYKSRIYAQLGRFFCSGCGYKREEPDCEISSVSSDAFSTHFTLDLCGEKRAFSSKLTGIYNCYNFACAALILHALGLDITEKLSDFSGAFGRCEIFKSDNKSIMLLLVKNPVGMQNCVDLIRDVNSDASLVFALNDNAADGRDISWIWDCDFSRIKSEKIYALGTRASDMALRLKYSNLNVREIISSENYDALIKLIKDSKNDFIVFANYTAMMNIRRYFVNEFGGEEFWKEEK